MQDLAISARVTWRPLALVNDPQTLTAVVPASPLRLALALTNAVGGGIPSARLGRATDAPVVNRVYVAASGDNEYYPTISAYQLPGIFNDPLHLNLIAADVVAWEAVIDSDLSLAVQQLNREISQRGG